MWADPIEESICREFGKKIWTKFRRGVRDYRLINEGDRIAACISGGKDSFLMAMCLLRLQRNGEIPFEVRYIVMNPGYGDEALKKIKENCGLLGLPVSFYNTNIFDSAARSPKNPCFLCSRLRRGWLYKKAAELGCNKIALGHHFDDVVETILMGMLYGSQMQTMMPKLHSENYSGMELIRPLYLVREADISEWAEFNGLEFIRCSCAVSEKKENGGSKRAEIKALLAQLRRTNPSVDMNIFRSAENVNLQTLISYHIGENRRHFLDDYEDGRTIRGTKINTKKPLL
ncbi:MAG: tRNA 2-thiocytidine biosynthesis protein TtcA [Ruminococcus sp.]|nr:tRNA 2-thiocytidine biosynthesis protein TtcA [Ruminococcus sp.]